MHCMHAYPSYIFLVINIGNSTKNIKTLAPVASFFANQVSDSLTLINLLADLASGYRTTCRSNDMKQI